MKNIIYFLFLCLIAFSCSKGNISPAQPACKVISMKDNIYTYNNDVYTYNSKGQLISVENLFHLREFSYDINKINIMTTQGVDKIPAMITLDNQGRVSKYVGPQKTLDTKYNSEGFLTEIRFHSTQNGNDLGNAILDYQNGNLVKILISSANANELKSITYSNLENKANNGFYSNFPLAQLLDFENPELIALWGKGSKNLLKEISGTSTIGTSTTLTKDIWDFMLNENGNVALANRDFRSGQTSFSNSFTYTYKCN